MMELTKKKRNENKEVSDSDRHATNYDDEWLTVNA